MMKKKRSVLCVLLLIAAVAMMGYGSYRVYQAPAVLEYTALPHHADEGKTPLLLEALETAKTDLTSQIGQMTASALARGQSITSSSGKSATVSVQAVGAGWFDVYHRTLADGRLPMETELSEGAKVAVVDEKLAFQLYGENTMRDVTINVGGTDYTIIGIVKHQKQAGETDAYCVYLPLPTALSGTTAFLTETISVLPAPGGNAAQLFEQEMKSAYTADGVMVRIAKEQMRQTLPVRYLLVIVFVCVLLYLLKLVNRLTMRNAGKLAQRHKRVYYPQMILPVCLFLLECAAMYGFILSGAYLTISLAVSPAYTFTEWVPDNLASLSSIAQVFTRQKDLQAELVTITTPLNRLLQYYGMVIKWGALLALLALALPMKRKKEKKQTEQ